MDAITSALEQGAPFPIEVTSGRKIKHLITKEVSSSGHFMTMIEHSGETYRIYLI